MCSSLMEEVQTLDDSNSLACSKSEEILPMEVDPLPQTMEVLNASPGFAKSEEILGGSITGTLECDEVLAMEESPFEENPQPKSLEFENPSADFAKSDEILGGSITKTLEFGGIVGNAEAANPVMDDAQVANIKEVQSSGTLEDCDKEEGEKLENICGDGNLGSSSNDNDDCGMIGGPISNYFSKRCDCNRCFDGEDDHHRNHEHFRSHRMPNCMKGEPKSSQRDPRLRNKGHDFADREPGWFPYRSSGWSEPEPCPVGAGLSNLGNTCFLNVIMQCFTHTVPLVEGIQSLKHDASSHGQDEFCVLCAVRDQIEHSLAFSGKIISPYNLVDNLNHISSCFQKYQQEDAHEYLQCLLDKLDDNWSKHESNIGELSSHDSLVKQVFGGRLVSQLRCCKCGYNSDSYEPMNDLSLEIEDVDNLESAFKSFTKVENLEDTTNCDRCNEKVQREKQLLLDQAPSVAALHLKRFKSDGIRVEKIDRMVEYPLELDLAPYTKGARHDNEDLKYELYGFVVHVGFSSTSGHYFCYIRTSSDEWYRFDDSKVTKVSEKTALDQEAYILFYARKGTPWFSGLLDKWKARLQEKSNTSPKSVLDSTNLTSATSVTDAEPLCCLRLDEVDMEDITAAQEPSTCLGYGEDVVGEDSENHKDEIGKISLETLFESNVKNHFAGEPKDDVEIVLPTSAEPGSPGIYTDEEPAAEVTYQIPLAHLKTQKKESPSSLVKDTVKKAKHDMERKEAAKYVKSSSMPIGRRQMLMAAINSSRSDNLSKKRRNPSSLTHKHSPRKQVKICPKRPLRAVAATV